jgi:hypothetical protein
VTVAQHLSGKRPAPPITAVIQVSDDDTATLYIGTEPVEHAAGVDAATVMRVLADYAATLDTDVRVTTQMPDGTWTRHRLHPGGELTPLPRNLPAAPTTASSVASSEASRTQRRAWWPHIRSRAVRGWLLAILILLVAALMAAVAMT